MEPTLKDIADAFADCAKQAVGADCAETACAPQKTYEQHQREVLADIFAYHDLRPGQAVKVEALRVTAKAFAESILTLVPGGSDQIAAIRKVRDALMTANAAIALDGKAL